MRDGATPLSPIEQQLDDDELRDIAATGRSFAGVGPARAIDELRARGLDPADQEAPSDG